MLEVVRTQYTRGLDEHGNRRTNNVFECKWITMGIIDAWYSLIWVDRYNEAGEFELKIEASKENVALLHEDYYLLYSMSDHAMVIEKVELITDVEDGDYLLVSGRSLESILDRRIVYTRTKFLGKDIARTTKAQISEDPSMIRNVIYALIRDAFGEGPSLSPTYRTVFELGYFLMVGGHPENQMAKVLPTQAELAAADNHPFMEMFVTAEMYSDTLYDIIVNLCQQLGIGLRIELTPVNDSSYPGTGTQFVVHLYYGLNLTEDLNQNQSGKVVIFSNNFNNLLTSEYSLDRRDYKNFVKIDGIYHEKQNDQEVEVPISTTVEGQIRDSGNNLVSPMGLTRHETYYDGSSISDKINATVTTDSSGVLSVTITDTDKFLGFISYSSAAHFTYLSASSVWHYEETNTNYTKEQLSDHGISIGANVSTAYMNFSVSYSGDEHLVSEDAYINRLKNEGNGILIEKDYLEDFVAEVAPNVTYKYGEDYSLGDIVSFANSYGVFLHCRITEVTFSEDENGFDMQPTFEPVSSNLQ